MLLRRLLLNKEGATAIEYALVASMISIACISGMQAIGGQSKVGWQAVWEKTKDAVGY
jgi:Flp pilus assembly pilin Flp